MGGKAERRCTEMERCRSQQRGRENSELQGLTRGITWRGGLCASGARKKAERGRLWVQREVERRREESKVESGFVREGEGGCRQRIVVWERRCIHG